MDANYYLETIRTVFQEFKLVHGTWDVRAPDGRLERVRPQDIRGTGLLTVEGELDDISGSGQTRAAHDLCTGIEPHERHHFEVQGAGHYGIFSGRRWREKVYPVVRDFIRRHQPAMPGPDTESARSEAELMAAAIERDAPAAGTAPSGRRRPRRPTGA